MEEAEQHHVEETILHLTLEIICLLTGEAPPSVFDNHVTVKIWPLQPLMLYCETQQKILEVTKKIAELLTGESEDLMMIGMRVKDETEDVHKRRNRRDSDEENPVEISAAHKNFAPLTSLAVFQSAARGGNTDAKRVCPGCPNSQSGASVGSPPDPKDSKVTERNVKSVNSRDRYLKVKEEDGPVEIGSDGKYCNEMKECSVIFPDCVPEDDDLTTDSPPDLSSPTPNPAQHNPFSDATTHEECFPNPSPPLAHRVTHRRSKRPRSNSKGSKVMDKSRVSRITTADKPYSCFVCGKLFTCRSAIIRHERFHTGEKPYSCSHCGKCFSLSSHLNRHERIHRGEKPYSCQLCGKCFSQKSNLDAHERVHTGEKPYSCTQCGKCFSTKVHLVVHERVHTGLKPYTCLDCGRYFSRKSSLIKHKSVHTG